jgi:uncharacterized membrane protein YraQ (UPF0718 family)
MVVFEIVPNSLAAAGWPALIGLLVGILGPSIAEGRFGAHGTHRAAIWVALAGMALHAMTDGLALASVGLGSGTHALEYAVVLHRLPVGLAIWWLMSERKIGPRYAPWLVLIAIAAATGAGFFLGSVSFGALGERSIGLFEAMVGGLLMHVVSHGVGKNQGSEFPRVAGIGGLIGLALVGALFWHPDGGGHAGHVDSGSSEFTTAFIDMFLDSAPALLIAYLLAGLISGALGEAPMRWLRRGGHFSRATRGVAFGLPLPLCSCGVVPVYRSLVRRGVPATAALAFLVATPELGLDAVLLSLPLLGPEMAVLRVLAAFALALIVGWLVGAWADKRARARAPEAVPETPKVPWGQRMREGIQTGFGEVLDGTGPWIVIGLVVAASLTPWLDSDALAKIPPVLQVGLFALIGMPIYVCATGATPMVAVLIAKGMTPGAALAFLLTGPATNVTTFGVLKQLHGRKVAVAFVVILVLSAVAMGYGVDLLLPEFAQPKPVGGEHGEHGLVSLGSGFALGGLFVFSFIRQGPRRYLGRLWETTGHTHDHEGDDGHDHGDGDGDPQTKDSCCASACGGGEED